MSESFNQKGNLIEIEAECEKLNHLILNYNSNRLLLVALTDFYEKLLQTKQTIIIDAYISQYINEYKNCLSSYDPFYISPITTEKIIESAKHIFTSLNENVAKDFIINQINRVERKSGELNKVLIGYDANEFKGLYFPALEQEILQSKKTLGLLECLTVQIRKSKNETKYLVIPSELHLEEKIQKQIDDSWVNAINFLKKNKIKISEKNYEILIAFDLKEGTIIGNSLGVVLTIYFIEELLKFYDSSLIVKPRDNIVITGGLDYSGKIISTSTEIIRIKTEIVFYSSAKTFCVPKVNEIKANERLIELNQQYPNRSLEIIGLTDLDDLLNRRNVVDVHKKNLIQIVATIILRKWKSILLAMVLTIVFSFLFVLDFDDNPSSVSSDGQLLHIKNKKGKILWTLNYNLEQKLINDASYLRDIIQLVDIDGDEDNEIIFAPMNYTSSNGGYDIGTIVCLNKTKKQLWKTVFRDSVKSEKEILQPIYGVTLIDTSNLNGQSILLCSANNATSFSSAIFMLDLKTGKRINKTLWCSGFTWDGIITNLLSDSQKYFVGIGADNGLGAGVVWGIKLDSLSGVRPSTPEYSIKNKPVVDLLFYIQIPKTDFNNYIGARTEGMIQGSLEHNKLNKKIKFITHIANDTISISSLHYYLDENLVDIDISVTDQFSKARDSLVTRGVLNKPLTDTKEFVDIQKSKILYWKNGKWIKRNEL